MRWQKFPRTIPQKLSFKLTFGRHNRNFHKEKYICISLKPPKLEAVKIIIQNMQHDQSYNIEYRAVSFGLSGSINSAYIFFYYLFLNESSSECRCFVTTTAPNLNNAIRLCKHLSWIEYDDRHSLLPPVINCRWTSSTDEHNIGKFCT